MNQTKHAARLIARALSISALAYGLFFVLVVPSHAQMSFAPNVDFSTGNSPIDVAIADFDGDGKLDMAVTNYGDSTVSLFRNTSTNGSVSFSPQVNLPVAGEMEGVAATDLDGDGKPDLVTANAGSNSVSVLRNTSTSGNISFASAINLSVGCPHRVAIGDLDGDGKPDMVVSSNCGASLVVFRNTSSPGAVSFVLSWILGTPSPPNALALADIDGDGKLDVVAPFTNNSIVSIYLNQSIVGAIAFQTRVDFPTGGSPNAVAIADLDGDGKPDVAVANVQDNTVSVFRNLSTPSSILLTDKVDYATGGEPDWMAIRDLDGDGKPDIVIASAGRNSVSILQNLSGIGTISFTNTPPFATGVGPGGVACSDVNGDGKPDLVTSNSANSVSILLNTTVFPLTGLKARVGDKSVYLTWGSPTSGAGGYRISIERKKGDAFAPVGYITLTGDPEETIPAPNHILIRDFTPLGAETQISNDEVYRLSVIPESNAASTPAIILAQPGTLPLTVAPRPPHPILFLHGFDSDSLRAFEDTRSFMKETKGWTPGGHMVHESLYHGVRTFDPEHQSNQEALLNANGDFFTADFSNNIGSLDRQAQEVSDFISALNAAGVHAPYTVIAHSNGGLATRACLLDTNLNCASTLGQVVTYGTPHRGADVATFRSKLLAEGRDRCNWLPFDFKLACLDYVDNLDSRLSSSPQAIDASFTCGTDNGLQLSPFLESHQGQLPDRLADGTAINYASIAGVSDVARIPIWDGITIDILMGNRRSDGAPEDCASKYWDTLVPLSSAHMTEAARQFTTDWSHTTQGGDFTAILSALGPTYLKFALGSPVEMEVTAPDGRKMAKDFAGIPGAAHMEIEDRPGHRRAVVLIPFAQAGEYKVNVSPKPQATASDTFTLTVSTDQGTTVVAHDVRVQDIPVAGYTVQVQLPADQTITFGPLPNKVFGDPPFVLSATATSGLPVTLSLVSGPATLTGNIVTLSGAGTAVVRASQAGDAGYNPAPDVLRSFAVAKATPTLTWPTSADLTLGTALSGAQLNASASVPGAFVYSPPGGTILPVGPSQALSVLFTPTDTANYTSATATVPINVVYNYSGFFQPVDNFPSMNARKAGSAVPMKFSLSGSRGLNILAPGYPTSGVSVCDSTAAISVIEEAIDASTSSLTYDVTNNQYVYVWKTQKEWAGSCRQFVLKLIDGSYHRANFILK